ncbi:hypothetical protein AVEN_44123-1 [Araneus ventricosus]|uniref:Uncharacterized protein n=1 Tax=Araneus ventricosus TaxID=182803 RepID=A0A4Y2DCP8_ARAVE|nr:hypothetical protein AVEN_44123-1 [Araneus ventricosus]
MLQLYAVPQFPEGVILQQNGAPPHYGNIVRAFPEFPARRPPRLPKKKGEWAPKDARKAASAEEHQECGISIVFSRRAEHANDATAADGAKRRRKQSFGDGESHPLFEE